MKIERLFLKNVTKKLLFLVTIFTSNALLSAIPTTEGLFRNTNNGDLTGNIIKIRAIIRETKDYNFAESSSAGETADLLPTPSATPNLSASPYYFEFIFSLGEEKRTELLQLEFSRSTMEKNFIKKVTYVPNLLKRIKEDKNLASSLFYSLLLMFATNDANGMMTTLNKIVPGQPLNREILNTEKVTLLKNYQHYLTAIKANPAQEGELKNPMKPEDPEEMERVKNILKDGMYSSSPAIKIVKKENQFFWNLSLENFTANFFQDTHRMRDLTTTLDSKTVNLYCGEYLLFDGVHELPKVLFFNKAYENRVIEISMSSLSNINDKSKKFYERYKEYKELEEKVVNTKISKKNIEPDRSILLNVIY